MLDVVRVQLTRKPNGLHNGIVGFSQMAKDEVGLCDDPCLRRHVNDMGDLLLRDVLAHRIQNPLTAGLYAKLNRVAARVFHQLKHIEIGDKVYAGTARPREGLPGFDHRMAEGLQTLAVAREHVIVEEQIINLIALM